MSFAVEERPQYLLFRFHIPASANALSLNAARELNKLTRQFKKWRRPVVVTSDHPRVFCSGGNLTDYQKLKSKAAGLKVNREITECLNTFAEWDAIKIALVNGDVLGGGMEWLARFDFRWSVPEAMFAFWQRRIGLSPGWGGGRIWAERIGEPKLRALLVAAAPQTASSALKLGLIDRIYLSANLDGDLDRFCTSLDRDAVRAVNRFTSQDEGKIFSRLWLSDDHAETLKRWR